MKTLLTGLKGLPWAKAAKAALQIIAPAAGLLRTTIPRRFVV